MPRTFSFTDFMNQLLSIEWNWIKIDGSAHGIGTKTVHKTLPVSFFLSVSNWVLCSYLQSNTLLDLQKSSLLFL